MNRSTAVQESGRVLDFAYSFGAGSVARSLLSDERNYRFIALQPIFDRSGGVFGYEALARSGRSNCFTDDPRTATRRLISDWLFDRFDRLTSGKPAFLNCSREDLLGGLRLPLCPPIVLEVLETVNADEEVVAACQKLKRRGHKIALDDFQICEQNEGLIPLADYVKIDFRLSNHEERREILYSLSGRRIQFVAEKIETVEEMNEAQDEGFHLFQGYYLGRPTVLSKRKSGSGRSVL